MVFGAIFKYNTWFAFMKGMLSMKSSSEIIAKLELSDLYLNYTVEDRPIGAGSYGYVYTAYDKTTGEKVAIKILKDFPEDTVDRKRLFREIKVLHMLKGRENTIALKHITTSMIERSFLGVALVFEHHETDLFRIIQSSQSLSTGHLQYFLHQLLAGIHYTHSANLVHRDLKPANILVNQDCRLTICDFGLARATHAALIEKTEHASPPPLYRKLTHYVVTRWYRPPELVFGNSNAGEAPADMWSIGCILAELLLRTPLFQRSFNAHSLIRLIFDILGTPPPEDCDWIEDEQMRNEVKRYQTKTNKIDIIFAGKNPNAIDLLKKLLHINPSKRLTAEQALQHPFVSVLSTEAPLTFSAASMSEVERKALNDYYSFEVDSENCDQSETLNQRIDKLLHDEVALYRTQQPSTASVTSSSAVSAIYSPSTVPGTVFHHQEPNSSGSAIDSQQIEKAETSATQSPECALI